MERAKAESDRSLKAEINRLSRQLVIRDSSNTPMSAMTTVTSSGRLESTHTTPQRGPQDQRTTSDLHGKSVCKTWTLKGASITRDEINKFSLEPYDVRPSAQLFAQIDEAT